MKPWHSIILALFNVVLAAYLVLALTAFNHPDNSDNRCQQVEINIAEGKTNGFLTEKGVLDMLRQHDIVPLGYNPDSINIRKVEDVVKASPLVKNADACITTDGKLIIDITQRLPVMRVKTYNSDYFVDDSGNIMPTNNYQSDVVIVTGYVSKGYAQRSLFPLVNTINGDELWQQQIEQINVTASKGIELVPRVGNHIVYIGQLPSPTTDTTDNISEFLNNKLQRLKQFYRYGLSKVGWDTYTYINLEYDNQIICK